MIDFWSIDMLYYYTNKWYDVSIQNAELYFKYIQITNYEFSLLRYFCIFKLISTC